MCIGEVPRTTDHIAMFVFFSFLSSDILERPFSAVHLLVLVRRTAHTLPKPSLRKRPFVPVCGSAVLGDALIFWDRIFPFVPLRLDEISCDFVYYYAIFSLSGRALKPQDEHPRSTARIGGTYPTTVRPVGHSGLRPGERCICSATSPVLIP